MNGEIKTRNLSTASGVTANRGAVSVRRGRRMWIGELSLVIPRRGDVFGPQEQRNERLTFYLTSQNIVHNNCPYSGKVIHENIQLEIPETSSHISPEAERDVMHAQFTRLR